MTVRTMPIQPGRDTGAEQGPVPWRGMLWVTWRQHRGLLISVPATFVVAVAGTKVARELEDGTYRYAWTQGIGRVRWTVAKLTCLGLAVTIPALIISQLFTWPFVPFLTTQDLTVLTRRCSTRAA